MKECKHETYSHGTDEDGHHVFVCRDCGQDIYRDTPPSEWKILEVVK